MVGAAGPNMISLAAELADGWFPAGFAPGVMSDLKPLLQKGFARAGNGKGFDNFEIWAHVDCNVDDDVATAMRPFKEYVVSWAEIQQPLMNSRGYPHLAERLIELRSAGQMAEAVAAIPDEYIDEGWLVGSITRI